MATPAFHGPRTLRPRLFARYLGEGVARRNSPAPGLDKRDFTRCLVSPFSMAPTRPRGFGPGVTLQRQPCSLIPRAGPHAGPPLPPQPPETPRGRPPPRAAPHPAPAAARPPTALPPAPPDSAAQAAPPALGPALRPGRPPHRSAGEAPGPGPRARRLLRRRLRQAWAGSGSWRPDEVTRRGPT